MSVTLYTCSLDEGGPKLHPCRKVHEELTAAGVDYETNVFDKNRPMGLFTKGKRPELKRMTGQEKLPVLQLEDGSFITGSKNIIEWGRSQGG
jgi:glutathione S-transferase